MDRFTGFSLFREFLKKYFWGEEMSGLPWLSAIEIARLVGRKEISPVEVVKTFISRIEEVNPKLGAIVTLAADEAIAAAQEEESSLHRGEISGPLNGVPLLIKDNVFTRGLRTTFGSLLYENYVPAEDAVLVERLKAAGAIVFGKTNLPEFGLVPVTDNLVFGPTVNPWNLSKTCGGSSGGSAAALAAGLGPIATGNDAGGSIRLPASLCGVYGLKPTFGLIPRYPRLPGLETIFHEGPLTRTVADAALMLTIMAGPDERDRHTVPLPGTDFLQSLRASVKNLRIAYSPDLGHVLVDREVATVIGRAASVFSELGAFVEEVKLEISDLLRDLRVMTTLEIITANEERLAEWKTKAHPLNLPLFSMVEKYAARDLVKVQFRREELWDKMHRLFAKYDLLLTPTSPVPAFDAGEGRIAGPDQINGRLVRRLSWLGFTLPFNFTGQPAASVPCGFTKEGLPVGLQIIGRRFADQTVLNASAAFEEARPWRDYKPSL